MPKRLYRSQTERMIAGVCGGLAEYFDVDPVFMRLAFVLLAFLTGIGFLLYPLLWIIMPEEGSVLRPPREVVRENLDKMRDDAERLGEDLGVWRATGKTAAGETASGETTTEKAPASDPATERSTVIIEPPVHHHHHSSGDRQFIAGVIVLLLGLLLLLQNLNLFWWASFWRLWPLVLIVVGVFLLYRQTRTRR